jgi:hypothetical protein
MLIKGIPTICVLMCDTQQHTQQHTAARAWLPVPRYERVVCRDYTQESMVCAFPVVNGVNSGTLKLVVGGQQGNLVAFASLSPAIWSVETITGVDPVPLLKPKVCAARWPRNTQGGGYLLFAVCCVCFGVECAICASGLTTSVDVCCPHMCVCSSDMCLCVCMFPRCVCGFTRCVFVCAFTPYVCVREG